MKKVIAAIVIAVVAISVLAQTAMAGNENDKVFVCKYVGKPGVDETLQTGQNPISVSVNAIPDFPGIGGFFADAQGRSLVIAFDTGQDEPSCPAGQGCEEDEDCNPPPPPVDVCPNLEGNQSEVPPDYALVDGECVPVVITPNCAPPAVLVNGVCVLLPPPPPLVPPAGIATVFCDLGSQVYRLRGTIDGQAVDSVDPATIPGNQAGYTNVTLHRGDTSFRTFVFTYGDCSLSPPVVVTTVPITPTAVTTTTTPTTTTAPKPVVASKPKRKLTVKKVVKHKTVHICKTLKNGTPRVWVMGQGCHVVLPDQPSHLTG